MKIQCDVCEKAPATVICCADEAALCSRCDVEVHAANKLASKHQRLLLDCLAARLPRCDICQEKAAFIFCVEDRALFCRDCDEPIHVAGTLSGQHQRYLATGIRVAPSRCSSASKDTWKITNPPEPPSPRPAAAVREAPSFLHSSPWAVPQLLQLSDYDSGDKKESPVGFSQLDPFADFGLLHAQMTGGGDSLHAAAQVPELPNSGATFAGYCRSSKGSIALKRPRMEISDEDDDEFFTVPDLGKIY